MIRLCRPKNPHSVTSGLPAPACRPQPPNRPCCGPLQRPEARGARRRFQLVGIACLRAAMGTPRSKEPQEKVEREKELGPGALCLHLRPHIQRGRGGGGDRGRAGQHAGVHAHRPNAKMFLRSFWYRSVVSGLLTQDEMHIYTVARHDPRTLPTLRCERLRKAPHSCCWEARAVQGPGLEGDRC